MTETLEKRLNECCAYFDKHYRATREAFGPGGGHLRRKYKTCRMAKEELERVKAERDELFDVLESIAMMGTTPPLALGETVSHYKRRLFDAISTAANAIARIEGKS